WSAGVICSTRSWSFVSTLHSSFLGWLDSQVYDWRSPFRARSISDFWLALYVPCCIFNSDVVTLESPCCWILNFSVPTRFPFTKMPKLPESQNLPSAAFCSFCFAASRDEERSARHRTTA